MNQPLPHPLGFEVYEPHGIVLPDFCHWTQQFSHWFGLPINGTLHLHVSTNFQERAEAYMEMMQLWVKGNRRELLIEFLIQPLPGLEVGES